MMPCLPRDEDTYATALTFLAERFQRFLADRDSHGIMVIDSRRPEVDDRMRRFFERLQREGTPYQRLDRIVDALFLGPSHYSIGLQAADLVVASTLAAQASSVTPADGTSSCYRGLRGTQRPARLTALGSRSIQVGSSERTSRWRNCSRRNTRCPPEGPWVSEAP